ncbi:MAG: hypothetical protein JWO71_171 [Candidatus Acidoferrum typicum]|nr:hypothetical protein [Candidatus Acidoferrum typicum]
MPSELSSPLFIPSESAVHKRPRTPFIFCTSGQLLSNLECRKLIAIAALSFKIKRGHRQEKALPTVSPFRPLLQQPPDLYSSHQVQARSDSQFTSHDSQIASHPFLLAPLFSHRYKPLFSQPPCFHIYTKPPGCHPFTPQATETNRPSPFLLITSLQTQQFHAITHSFAQRDSSIFPIFNTLRTLLMSTGVVPPPTRKRSRKASRLRSAAYPRPGRGVKTVLPLPSLRREFALHLPHFST